MTGSTSAPSPARSGCCARRARRRCCSPRSTPRAASSSSTASSSCTRRSRRSRSRARSSRRSPASRSSTTRSSGGWASPATTRCGSSSTCAARAAPATRSPTRCAAPTTSTSSCRRRRRSSSSSASASRSTALRRLAGDIEETVKRVARPGTTAALVGPTDDAAQRGGRPAARGVPRRGRAARGRRRRRADLLRGDGRMVGKVWTPASTASDNAVVRTTPGNVSRPAIAAFANAAALPPVPGRRVPPGRAGREGTATFRRVPRSDRCIVARRVDSSCRCKGRIRAIEIVGHDDSHTFAPSITSS